MAEKERRQVRVPVSGITLSCMLGLLPTGLGGKIESDLPDDAQFVRWFLDPYSDCLMLVFEHESFEVVEEGRELPLHCPMIYHYPPEEVNDG